MMNRRMGLMLAMVVGVLGMSRLAAAQPKEKLKKEGQEIFKPSGGGGAAGKESKGDAHWSVVIEGFRGADQESMAAIALDKVRTQGGLAGAYMEKRGPATVVAYGRFASGESKEAKEALAKVRGVEIVIAGGVTRPFADAFLAPPAEIPGSMPEYDLRQAKKRHGDWAIYTLQIGVYARIDDKPPSAEDLKEFRRFAELAVTQLRREGEQAFYFHGPNKSMVTVGLFGTEDFDPQTPGVESPGLKVLRKRYPRNDYNGQGIKEKVKVTNQQGKVVETERIQASRLVEVPKGE